MLNLNEAITAAQSAKKQLAGADGAVEAEQLDVANERIVLATKEAELKTALDDDAAAKEAYKKSLGDLRDAVDAEISAL